MPSHDLDHFKDDSPSLWPYLLGALVTSGVGFVFGGLAGGLLIGLVPVLVLLALGPVRNRRARR